MQQQKKEEKKEKKNISAVGRETPTKTNTGRYRRSHPN